MTIKEGILIPSAVEDIIITALDDIFAGDTTSAGAQLFQLKSVLVILSQGQMVVDEGTVYKIDKQLSPGIIKKTLQAGCVPVRYEERQRLADNTFGPEATPIDVYLLVAEENKNNPSDVDGESWLDRANAVGMTEGEDGSIAFLGKPLDHPDVTLYRDNPHSTEVIV